MVLRSCNTVSQWYESCGTPSSGGIAYSIFWRASATVIGGGAGLSVGAIVKPVSYWNLDDVAQRSSSSSGGL